MKKEKLDENNKKKKYEISNINYTIICNSDNKKDENLNKENTKRNCKTSEDNKGLIEKLDEKILIQINNLNYMLSKGKVIDLIELTGNSKKFLIRNFTSGIAKGIGAGIGFSIVTALIIYLLQKIIKLNIPVISQYISDIIEIVQSTK